MNRFCATDPLIFTIVAARNNEVLDPERSYFTLSCCPFRWVLSFERLLQHLTDKHQYDVVAFDLETGLVWAKHKK